MKCIYCRLNKPSEEFRKREHVIPASFGRFESNLVLRNRVCDSCNQFFGDNLEIHLACDTYEGLYRFESGIKTPKEYRGMGKSASLVIRIQEGLFRNAYAFVGNVSETSQLGLRPVEQIGLRKRDAEEYDFFLIDSFPKRDDINLSLYDFDYEKSIIILSDDIPKAKKLLETIGVTFAQEGELSSERRKYDGVVVEVTSTISEKVSRCVAKI